MADLLADAGLELVLDTAYVVVQDLDPGWRPPPWAAREAMVAAGFADQGDLARWQEAFEEFDATDRRPRGFIPLFVAAGREPI